MAALPRHLASIIGIAALLIGTGAHADPAVKAAASRFVADVAWQEQSVLVGEFSCEGRQQSAILGLGKGEIVVALFTHDLAHAPQVLRFASDKRKPDAAKIHLDDATALSLDEVEALAGQVPPGFQSSTTCKGVRLSDDASDAAHIYWDHQAKRFDSWSQ